jgi:hypothetical protein
MKPNGKPWSYHPYTVGQCRIVPLDDQGLRIAIEK